MPDNRDHQRPKTSPYGHPIVPKGEFEGPEVATGVLSGDELKAARARRETHERLEKLEETKDEHIAAIAGIGGQLGVLVKHAEDTEAYRRAREQRELDAAERERVRKWWIAIIGAIAAAIVAIVAAVR